MARIVIDAGHGGRDPGAVSGDRREKDDNLALATAVGRKLAERGVDVVFNRTEDVYQTPFEKAQMANAARPDFLVSIHRNSSPMDNQYNGIETLLYNLNGDKVAMAQNINQELEKLGFRNLGIEERPDLVILRRTNMPALLVEAGFINSDLDNEIFDTRFDETAQAIADGIINTLFEIGMGEGIERNPVNAGMGTETGAGSGGADNAGLAGAENNSGNSAGADGTESGPGDTPENRQPYYRVQTGAFRNPEYAQDMLYNLTEQGYPSFIVQQDGLYKVQTGAFERLDNAIKMEAVLRRRGYSTYLVLE